MKILLSIRDILNRIWVRYNRKITGKKSWLWISFFAFLLIGGVFYIAWMCNNRLDTWSYVYTVFKLNAPPCNLIGPGNHKWAYLLMGLAATLLIPFLTAALQAFINIRVAKRKEGRLIYHLMCDHVVLVGYNRYTTQILTHLLDGNRSYAIILTTQNPKSIREKLDNALKRNIYKRVIIYAGDALMKDKLKNLNLSYAKKLFLLDESETHCSQYTRNLSVLQNIVDEAANRTDPLEVYMQVNNYKAYNLLQRVDIPNEFFERNNKIVVDFHPFNFYENWARLLWSFHVLKDRDGNPVYEPLDFEPLENTDKQVHLVISKFSSMGHALLLEALRLCHYPNFDEKTGKNKTIITIFDDKWKEKANEFYPQYPKARLQQIKDIELDFQDIDIHSEEARTQMEKWAQDKNQLVTIVVSDKESDIAMTNALNLPEKVLRSNARILVRQEIETAAKEHKNQRAYPHLKFFGMLQEGVDTKQLDDKLAICIGGIYTFLQEKPFNLSDAQKLLECQQRIQTTLAQKTKAEWYKEWLKIAQTDKWSNRFQADIFHTYIELWNRHKNLSAAEFIQWQEILAEMEHRRWIAERTVYGFRKTEGDEKKDKVLKLHPDIIPYDDLDEDTKNYDRNIVNTAPLLVQEAEKVK